MLLTALAGSRSAQAHAAWGIVIDPQGRAVFSEVSTNSVWRMEREGELVRLVTGRHSHELFQDGQGGLHGEHVIYDAPRDRWLRTLWRLDPSGRFETPSAPATEIVRAQRMTEGLAAVNARVWGPDGALYVTDGQAVRRIRVDGNVATLGGDPLAGVSHGEHPRLLGLAVTPAGSVLVADADHGVVREVTPAGEVVDRWKGGPLWSPAGVAVRDGAVYLLESRPENLLLLLEKVGPWARVRRVDADGEIETLAVAGSWGRAAIVAAVATLSILALGWLQRRG